MTKYDNIYFKIGQPSTGKSYGFNIKSLQDTAQFAKLTPQRYKMIPVSGGVGNEYKGLQNTDLAISYDVVQHSIRLGEFLKFLMKAILNPADDYVLFLDDFHNQDISSLLSEYTPLFKAQQKVDLIDIVDIPDDLNIDEWPTTQEFIKRWNMFVDSLDDVAVVPITNRLSGEDIKLIYPSNFYLFGAANFNEKTTNIFADWQDRATITYIDPLEQMELLRDKYPSDEFVECVVSINNHLKDILENDHDIYDIERYCFGIWKIVDATDNITEDKEEQKKLVRFFFGMIKNSLIYNNKNSMINNIGKKLLQKLKNDTKDKFNMLFENELKGDITHKTLHSFGIYES